MSDRTVRPARGAALALMASVALVVAPVAATAQTTASEITPESFQPQLRALDGSLVFAGGTGTTAPPGAERIGITLGGVVLDGAFPALEEVNDAFRARLTRGRIPVSELFEATADLEAAYADAGFVLARVALPQQALRDGGTLRVEVIDGFVESVDTSGAPAQVRARLDALTGPLIDRAGLRLEDLERQLLLAGDTPGVALDSALAAGERAGGTVLSLDPEFRGVTGFVGFDNRLPEELDYVALSAGVEVNSPFQRGETFYLRASVAPGDALSSDPRYRVLAAGVLVPLGASGLSFNAEVTRSDTRPDDPDAPTRSDFERQSLRLIYPVIRSRKIDLTTQVSLDRQEDSQTFIGGGADTPLFRDRTTALRVSGSLSFVHPDDAVTRASLALSQGIDALGARSASDAAGSAVGLSREGSDVDFTKITGSVSHDRALGEAFSFGGSARFQSSLGDALPTAEQMSISGPSELSAFDGGDLRGDSAWALRAELSAPRAVGTEGRSFIVSPYAFAAVGGVSLERPTSEESSHENAAAYGIGLDLSTATGSRFRAGSIRLEFGKGERDDGPDSTRISLSGSYRF